MGYQYLITIFHIHIFSLSVITTLNISFPPIAMGTTYYKESENSLARFYRFSIVEHNIKTSISSFNGITVKIYAQNHFKATGKVNN